MHEMHGMHGMHAIMYRKLEKSEPSINDVVNFSIDRDAFIIFYLCL